MSSLVCLGFLKRLSMPWHQQLVTFSFTTLIFVAILETYGRLPWQFCTFTCEIIIFAPKLKGFYIPRRPWDEKLLWPSYKINVFWTIRSLACTVCYNVDTTTEHSPLKSSKKGIWWHLIGFFKPHFILNLWMIILLHLWNRRAFCLLRMVWIILAWQLLMVFTVTSSDCKVKKARFYEFWFTLGWR